MELAADNVSAARAHLAAGERYVCDIREVSSVHRGTDTLMCRLRAGAWGAGGAALGLLAGGPVGLAVGVKAGALAAAAGSLLGYAGARLLGERRVRATSSPADTAPRDKDD